MTQPILICFDRSPGARHALERAAVLFPGQRAIILTLWDFPLEPPAAGLEADESEQAGRRSLAAASTAEGCELARRVGLAPEAKAVCGSVLGVWQTILQVARDVDASVIVIGARGLHGLRSLMLTSASRELSQHADRPVLVVPSGVPGLRAEAPAERVGAAH